jgi:hypothetical protein
MGSAPSRSDPGPASSARQLPESTDPKRRTATSGSARNLALSDAAEREPTEVTLDTSMTKRGARKRLRSLTLVSRQGKTHRMGGLRRLGVN